MSDSAVVHEVDRSLVTGIAWTAVLRWASQLISWGATFYAAHVLVPGDFGLIAMAMVAIGLARMVQEFGLDAILVQDRGIVGDRQARMAGMLIAFGVLLCIAYYLASGFVARFFGEPKVGSMVAALGLLFVFDAIQIVPYAELQRRLEYRRLAIVLFTQAAVVSVALVTAVSVGLGTWSLVFNQLAGEAAVTALLLYWAPYRVAWPREMANLARPLMQGWRMLVSRFIWYAYTTADQTIIGRVLGKDLLGTYSFALTLSAVAQREIGAVVSKVAPGIFSEVQGRRDELRRYFLLLTEFVTILSFPLTIGLALVADLLIPLLLGEQWRGVVPPLRWLCACSVLMTSQLMVAHVLLWTGQFRVNMWCTVIPGAVIPVAILLAVNAGLEAIAIAWTVALTLASVPPFYFALRTINISLRPWINAILPATTACALMAVAVLTVRYELPGQLAAGVQTAVAVAVGAVTYPAALWLLFRGRMQEMFQFTRHLRDRA
jgi:O-antigen/teichoic acid export membrane protein